eukprot:gnl/TRDRNA2_/TRDRNA2_29669_c0_seq1.p1 gnl/TRDRNA2_/TRDRNA2_29669_c0~~gnl/TRDRNA2_/TRDRNA2_29669_c0_seq1.p1  ORF type:complete len:258 (+),score=47.47 gnl/TRDRNA2_/TRDRNA2_29669_c0_seq1:44-775(+)
MGCGTSKHKPQPAASVCQQTGCEWTVQHKAEIDAITEIVGKWARGGENAAQQAKADFRARVLKGDAMSSAIDAAAGAAMTGGALGAAMGGLLGAGTAGAAAMERSGSNRDQGQSAANAAASGGALGAMLGAALGGLVCGLGAGMWATKVHDLVDNIFSTPPKEAKKLARETLSSGVISEVYSINEQTGQVTVEERRELLTGAELDDVFREKVRQLAQGQGKADRLVFLELMCLCLCIEVIRRC